MSWKFFPREQPEISLASKCKLSRNSNNVTNKHHQQCRLTQVKSVWRNCAEIDILGISAVFTINFIHRSSRRSLKLSKRRYYQKGFPLQNIKTRHKIKHNEMGLERLIKTITHSWRVGAKIMKQSKQVLKKNTAVNYQEGRKGEIVFRL